MSHGNKSCGASFVWREWETGFSKVMCLMDLCKRLLVVVNVGISFGLTRLPFLPSLYLMEITSPRQLDRPESSGWYFVEAVSHTGGVTRCQLYVCLSLILSISSSCCLTSSQIHPDLKYVLYTVPTLVIAPLTQMWVCSMFSLSWKQSIFVWNYSVC